MLDLLFDSEVRSLVQDILVYTLVLVALIWGSTPERAAIGVWWFCFEMPALVYVNLLGNDVMLTSVDWFMASRDVIATLLWIAIALYANRNYTLWIAGVQLLAVGSHVARGLIEGISPFAYASLVVAPGWLQLAAMSIGFARHILRKRKYGAYRDWRITRRTPVDGPYLTRGDLT